jgi:hypothetical protein
MRTRIFMTVVFTLLLAMPARPYTFNFTSGQHDHWATTPHYVINDNVGSNISGNNLRSVVTVIQSAFATWAQAPNSAAMAVSDGVNRSAGINNNDHLNTICFTCQGDFSKDSSTLAVTSTSTQTSGNVGAIVDADIAFNPSKNFTTDATASGQTGQDLETVAVHEIGHFFGLSHSGVVRAIMFPFAPPVERSLSYDDVAIISQLYPGSMTVPTTSISGTVRLNNNPVFGAHVFAESQTNALAFPSSVRKTPISALTDTNGNYTISGVPNDTYMVTAEPLDEPMSNSDIADYSKSFGRTAVDTNFTTRSH